MSLLHRGTETVTVYPEETTTDADGNTRTRLSSVGVVCKAVVQLKAGIVNAESQEVGFQTTNKYRLRLVGWQGGLLGAQSSRMAGPQVRHRRRATHIQREQSYRTHRLDDGQMMSPPFGYFADMRKYCVAFLVVLLAGCWRITRTRGCNT